MGMVVGGGGVTFSICFSRSAGCRVFFFDLFIFSFRLFCFSSSPLGIIDEKNINAFWSMIHRRSIGRLSTERLRLTRSSRRFTRTVYTVRARRSFCRYTTSNGGGRRTRSQIELHASRYVEPQPRDADGTNTPSSVHDNT